MSDEKEKSYRLAKVAKEFNVGTDTIIEFLAKKGYKDLVNNPNQKITPEQYATLQKQFAGEKKEKEKVESIKEQQKEQKERIQKSNKKEEKITIEKPSIANNIKVVGKIELEDKKEKNKPVKNTSPQANLFDNVESLTVEQETNETIATHEEQNQLRNPDQSIVVPTKISKEEVSENEILIFEKPTFTPSVDIQEETTEVETPEEDLAEANDTSEEVIRAKDKAPKLTGPTVLGKVDLTEFKNKGKNKPSKDKKNIAKNDKPVISKEKKAEEKTVEIPPSSEKNTTSTEKSGDKRKRKRNRRPVTFNPQEHTTPQPNSTSNNLKKQKPAFQFKPKVAPTQKEIDDQVKKTLSDINKTSQRVRQKIRKDKRDKQAQKLEQYQQEQQERANVLEVTEFLTANELANLMDVPVNEVIAKCMQLGLFVSINQRIDADVINLIAEEFGYQVEFVSVEETTSGDDGDEDAPEDLQERPPIVTVMGHVDHGKTSLLDYIRKSNVIAGEAGGITQHIGAYEVTLENGKKITFLDTPGHEAFTAMRARGAQITDIAIIVIAADDQIMPQTIEAINHAQAANVPMIFAINKIDKPGADPTKIRQQLAEMNILVEDWGGKYQCQEISAKNGINIDILLDKILIEAELLELKANPDRNAKGTIIEAKLDKGRGVVTTVLVQNGTLKIGDIIIANCHYGRVKAMFDERQKPIKKAGPSTPVQILGLNGVPQAGDKFAVMDSEREARELASKRQQLLREQAIKTQKHITLDEIARRRAIGNFKELNLIVKGDVDGSVEALADSLLKLSTDEVAVRIIHKAVGQISESDVLLASSSDAIIIGFQVRPSTSARKLAENEQIDIRMYSIIYDAINEVKDAIEGMLAPTIEEKIIGTAEVKEVFKISKVGTVAGCQVVEGKVLRSLPIRLIRDGIVVYTGKIDALKRFKDDVKEVLAPMECGISIQGFNDIKVGDIIENYEVIEIKRKLA